MFNKKEKADPNSTAKALLRIAVRTALRNYPEAYKVIKTICVYQGETNLVPMAVEILVEHEEMFKKDPLLEANIKDILVLLGLSEANIDVPRVQDLLTAICPLV